MYEWTCSSYDSANDRYYLPDYGDTSNIFQFVWEASIVRGSYVYPINEDELNCTGNVTALKFCYTMTLSPENSTPTNSFQFLTLTRNHSNTFEVTRSIQVTASPSEVTCMNNSHPHRCCEKKEFNPQDQFSITTPNLAIGFVLQQSTVSLQGWHASAYLNYSASSYISSSSLTLGTMHDLGKQGNNALRIFWLHISKFTEYSCLFS